MPGSRSVLLGRRSRWSWRPLLLGQLSRRRQAGGDVRSGRVVPWAEAPGSRPASRPACAALPSAPARDFAPLSVCGALTKGTLGYVTVLGAPVRGACVTLARHFPVDSGISRAHRPGPAWLMISLVGPGWECGGERPSSCRGRWVPRAPAAGRTHPRLAGDCRDGVALLLLLRRPRPGLPSLRRCDPPRRADLVSSGPSGCGVSPLPRVCGVPAWSPRPLSG